MESATIMVPTAKVHQTEKTMNSTSENHELRRVAEQVVPRWTKGNANDQKGPMWCPANPLSPASRIPKMSLLHILGGEAEATRLRVLRFLSEKFYLIIRKTMQIT